MSKRRRNSDGEEPNLRGRSVQERGVFGNKVYDNITLDGDGPSLLGDNYGTLVYSPHVHHHHYAEPQPAKIEKLLESLTFERMDARLRDVATALPDTCQWLFETKNFQKWSDANRVLEHDGFLWIKGKPGSGKSTIMKEAWYWAKRVWPDHIILTYFFNARSANTFEKSSLGLYRSLTYKLVEVHPDGHSCFSIRFATKVQHDLSIEPWTAIELQNFIIDLIATKKLPALTIFVDALDEGDDEDVRDLIVFLDKLSDHAMRIGAPLRICLSSRHYPQISLPRGTSIVLEDQTGHAQDIAVYVRRYLARDESETDELRHQVCSRSAGIFLWVVLVVTMLNKLYDQGKTVSVMMRKLCSIPQDLHQVFAEVLSRDAEDIDESLKLLRWVLFSLRPLRPVELYFAVQGASSISSDKMMVPTHGVVTRYLSNCSRGLVEHTEARLPTIQFIHETVRDFLMKSNVLAGLKSSREDELCLPKDFQADGCHASIAEECLQYLIFLSQSGHVTERTTKRHSLTEYAAEYWWQHARSGGQVLRPRLATLAMDLLTNRNHLLTWVRHYNIDKPSQGFKPTLSVDELASPLYYAASTGLTGLVGTLLEKGAEINAQGGRYGNALQVACLRGSEQMVQQLLDMRADVCARGGEYGTALQAAIEGGKTCIAQLLLSRGTTVHAQGGRYGTALQAASYRGNEYMVQLLLDCKADINARGGYYETALEAASAGGHESIVRKLLGRGAVIHAQSGKLFGNALCAAAEMGHETVVELLLLDDRVDINAQGQYFGSALQAASRKGYKGIVQMLLKRGADVSVNGGNYGTALHAASKNKHLEVVQMLLDAGAEA